MKIGLIDVDGHNGYPNLALMKISAWHKAHGDDVVWYDPMFTGHCDKVYMSKVFSFTKDYEYAIDADVIEKGGTGFDMLSTLPDEIEYIIPDYDLYDLPKNVAYGFLTRGCPNKCFWCVVPKKEGKIHAHCNVDDIAVNGRNKLILMDNNVLAHQHGLEQIEKMTKMKVWVDFNQGLDARLVTPDIADMLAKLKWINSIRFGCDTPKQVEECDRVADMLRARGFKKNFLFYTMLYGDINECYTRLTHWREKGDTYNVQAQPYIDFKNIERKPPQWQKDMAHWGNRKISFHACDFKDFSPRKGFKCREYFNNHASRYIGIKQLPR